MGNTQTKNQVKGRGKKQVHWKAADRPGPPGKPELVAGLEATPDIVTIRWDKPKHDGGAPITGYLVEHRRTGNPHWIQATPLLIPATELSLSGLEPGWRYQFRVSCRNTVGMSEPGEASEPLTVTLQRNVVTGPKFTEELKDSSILENEMAEFVVHFIGQPAPKLCWYKDGFEIFSSRRTRITTEADKSVLNIHQVALSDEGEIKCTATNRVGHVSTKAIIKVEAPPKIRLPRQYEEGLLFELDEVIRLKVSIAGRPQPLIFWSHNSEPLKSDDRYEIIDTDKSSTLKIGTAKRYDRGEYQIRAVNTIGEDSTSFLVTVTDRPKPPRNIKVIMSLGRSVTLSWNEPEDDGGCKIGAYIVEYFRVGWNVWLKAATCRHMTTMLNDLIEGSEYKFRIKAESPYGVSDPSDETDVIFIPDPKRGLMSAPSRSRSQPRDINRDDLPVPPKRRSTSSTRPQQTSGIVIPDNVPVRPKRERVKSPPKTPELSPVVKRKDASINTAIFDRASLARELSYGIDPKNRKSEPKPETVKLEVKQDDRSPSPSRNKSPSRLNSIISSILPGKKSPSPSKKSSSPKKSPSPNKKSLSPKEEVKPPEKPVDKPLVAEMLEVRTERSDLYDRSPSPIERRLSLTPSFNQDRRERSPSPSSPTKLTPNSPSGSRRGSINTNRQNSIDTEERGSSEFMLVLYPEYGDKYNQDREESSFVYFDLDEDIVPPPMSLSAPELGTEPPPFPFMRAAVSSTELLYERSLQRFRKEAEAEEAEYEKRKEEMEKQMNEKSKKEKIKVVEEEPVPTTDRRISIPKILINSQDQEDEATVMKKRSFKRRLSGGVTGAQQQYIWAKRRQSLKNQSELEEISEGVKEKKKGITPQSSTERDSEFEDEEDEYNRSGENRLHLHERSESQEREEKEFSRIRQRMEEKRQGTQNGGNNKYLALEEKWDSEEELSEEDMSDDERMKYDTMPPLVQVVEEETYHPRMSNIVITNTPPSSPKCEQPFEILTKPAPLPDPNFAPKPILKKPENNITAPTKPGRKSLENNNIPTGSLSPLERSPPKSRSPSKSPSKSPVKVSKELEANQPTRTESQLISAAEAAKSKRQLLRHDSEEEACVVADYYGSIVQEYGSLKRSKPRMYLNRDDLMKAAQEQEDELEKANSPKKSPEKSVKKSPKKSPEPTTLEEEYKEYEELLKRYKERPVIQPERPKLELQKRPEPAQRRQELTSAYDATRFQKSDYARPESLPESRFTHATMSTDAHNLGRTEGAVANRFATSYEAQSSHNRFDAVQNKPQGQPNPDNFDRPEDLQAYIDVTTRFQQIEARYHQLHSRPQEPEISRYIEPVLNKRQPSPSFYRRPLQKEAPKAQSYEPPPPAWTQPSPSPTTRRSMEVTPVDQRGRKTSRTRSTSRTRKSSRQRSETPSDIFDKISRSPSPRPLTPEQEQQLVLAEQKVRNNVDYATDVTMVLLAFYLYLFKDPMFAIPCLVITVYRQIKDSVEKWTPQWMKKKPS